VSWDKFATMRQAAGEVEVRHERAPGRGWPLRIALEYKFTTDAEGQFRADGVPVGEGDDHSPQAGYVRPGLGLDITTPTEDVELQMIKSSSARRTVDFFRQGSTSGYIVKIEPEGGEVVGKYGGSGNINEQNQITFQNVLRRQIYPQRTTEPISGNNPPSHSPSTQRGRDCGSDIESQIGAREKDDMGTALTPLGVRRGRIVASNNGWC